MKVFWMHLWYNITFLCLSCNLEFTSVHHCIWKPLRVLITKTNPILILTNLYYLPIYCCTFRSWQVSIFLLAWILLSKSKEIFLNASIRTKWSEETISLHRVVGHVISVFQYIERKHIFSINIYFCKHHEYFQLAWFL